MNIKKIAQKQYRQIINKATQGTQFLDELPEGWITSVRKSLGMSVAQLASITGVTRASISKVEKAETQGAVTLKKMQSMAQAMGCEFVYAIVPNENIESIILKQAQDKVKSQITLESTHMALEAQALSQAQLNTQFKRRVEELINDMPYDFWENK
ncbi:MAG: mobile mystery protein A [Saccharospirillaceae bacterium]|nr:mobile mystery protein A [Pseudomonadales bacterium]NRB77785.1 mobile mystery protein A [Saccharospirillaceae bacterium]